MNLHMQDVARPYIPVFIIQSELSPDLLLPAFFLTILGRLHNRIMLGKVSHPYARGLGVRIACRIFGIAEEESRRGILTPSFGLL